MDMTGADRQRRYRARRKQDHAALLDQLATLQVRVAQLEAELAARPPAGPKAPAGRLREAYLVLRREHDELTVTLAQIEAYQPGIAKKARAWVEQIDRTPRRW